MVRFYEAVTWLLNSIGVALLILSLVVAPTNTASAQEGGMCQTANCDDKNCFTVENCPPNGTGGTCAQTPPDCTNCTCRNAGGGCRCYPPA